MAPTIHFLKDIQLSQSFLQSLSNIGQLSRPHLSILLQFTFNLLTNQSNENDEVLKGQLQEYLKEQGSNDISTDEFWNYTKCLLFIFKSSVQNELTRDKLEADLKHLGCNQNGTLIARAFFQHAYQAVSLQSSKDEDINLNSVIDFEWRFGITASSSEMSRIGKPFVQMKFIIQGREDPVYLELRVDQFYEFLHEMEKAKTLGDMMSSS